MEGTREADEEPFEEPANRQTGGPAMADGFYFYFYFLLLSRIDSRSQPSTSLARHRVIRHTTPHSSGASSSRSYNSPPRSASSASSRSSRLMDGSPLGGGGGGSPRAGGNKYLASQSASDIPRASDVRVRAARWAVRGFTDFLRCEVKADGIGVTLLNPGQVKGASMKGGGGGS